MIQIKSDLIKVCPQEESKDEIENESMDFEQEDITYELYGKFQAYLSTHSDGNTFRI